MSSFLPTRPHPHASTSPLYPSAADEAAAYVARASSLHLHHQQQQQRSRSHTSVPLPDAKRPRSSATSSAAHDWTPAAVAGARLPSPALNPCTASWSSCTTAAVTLASSSTSLVPPPPPALSHAHCPTPALTPDDELEGRSGFVKRDDLTAKAVKRAQSMSGASSPSDAKDRFVNGLVGASVLAIESIWGPSSACDVTGPSPSSSPATAKDASVISLQWFVKEVLRRSRTSCSTLQLALYYLHKSRREIRAAVRRAGESEGEIKRSERELKAGRKDDVGAASAGSAAGLAAGRKGEAYPSPPRSPGHDLDAPSMAAVVQQQQRYQSLGDRFSALVEAQNSPVLCGRRMFLAALICASKYLQDRNYSNRAWAKISGLDVREINRNERAFLAVVKFELHLPADEFHRWTERLAALNSTSPSPSSSPASASASASASSPHLLARSASEYHVLGQQPHLLAANARPSVPSSRKALARGASAAVVYPTTSATSSATSTSTREKGFPIAAPRMAYRQPTPSSSSSSSSSEGEGEEEAEAFAESTYSAASASASASDGRKVRALPTRRLVRPARVTASPASFVPQSWAAGVGAVPMEGVVVQGASGAGDVVVDGVRAH